VVELYKSNSCYLQQDDDGFILYESRAMCRYIARKYASQGIPLIPTELKAEALFEQAASIETSYFYKHASAAVVEGVFKKYAVISISCGWFSK
jgi:glutathione S-transferase